MTDSVGATHHVKIDDTHLLVYPNSYFKRAAPAFGARFAGGDPSYSQLNFWQHWGQSCWIGGMGQDGWEDDAMYDYAVGVDTSQHDIIALSRGLATGGTGFALGGEVTNGRRFQIYKGVLYAYDYLYWSNSAVMYKFAPGTSTWSTQRTFTDMRVGSMSGFSNDLYVGTSGTKIRKWQNGSAWKQINKPKKKTDVPRFMHSYRQRLYVGFGNQLWRLKPNDKWDGNTPFFRGHGIDEYIDGTYHQGWLYIASKNGHIVRTDGNQTFDLYQFGGQTRITAIESYDGKVFIFTLEWYDDEDSGELVVYQMSGSAVTELKRYGRVGKTAMTSGTAVVARRMFYGASSLLGLSDETGFGLAVYDAREDAHSLFAAQRNTTTYPDAAALGKRYIIDDVVYFGNRFFVSVRGHGVFRVRYTHRDLERDIADYDNTWTGTIAAANNEGGVLVSSDFDAGTPGLEKIWRQIVVTADFPDASGTVHVAYSIDGGTSWVDMGSFTKPSGTTRVSHTFHYGEVKSARMRYKLQLATTDPDHSPFVRSVVVSFLPNPEPNWVWQFTAVLAEEVYLLDGTKKTQDVDAMRLALETAFRDDQLVFFEDIDGTEWHMNVSGVAPNLVYTPKPGALIQDITFSAPLIGPSSDGDIEYTVQLQLMEAVEEASA